MVPVPTAAVGRSARIRLAAAVLGAALLSPGGAPARADEVVLKDGRVLEGKIVEDTAAGVKLRTAIGGDVFFPRAQVERTVRKPLPAEALEEKRRALAADDVEGRWALALEARALQIRRVWNDLRAEVLRLDPDHAGANEAEGRVRHGERWVTPEERDRLAAEEERARRAAGGLVEYEGRWVTPEEKDARSRGLVLHEGRWMSEREAKEKQGYVQLQGEWVKRELLEAHALRRALADAAGTEMTVAVTPRFTVATGWDQEATDRVAADAEKTWTEFAAWFGLGEGDRPFDYVYARGSRERLPKSMGGEVADAEEDRDNPFFHGPRNRRCHIVLLKKDLQYQKFLDAFLRFHPEVKYVLRPERVELMKRQNGFYLVDPDCWIVGYQGGYPEDRVRRGVVHKLSHVLLWRWKYDGRPLPPWLTEGLGEMQEINALGRCETFCITTGYDFRDGEDKAILETWKATAKRMAEGGGDNRLEVILTKSLNDLTPWDLVKCWSVLHYLMTLDPKKLPVLVETIKKGTPSHEALARVYDAEVPELDRRWRDFVKRTY